MKGKRPRDERLRMVEFQLHARGIHDAQVLAAMRQVPRDLFVPEEWASHAYRDGPLPIGEGQTISQPYIVGLMTQALDLGGGERVLELGTGSGYQTAILLELGAAVWTVERSERLSERAKRRLLGLGYDHLQCIHGDGTLGDPEDAPFDRILATGSLPTIPDSLMAQLAPEGMFVGPVGGYHEQELVRIRCAGEERVRETLCECRFVPLVGRAGWRTEWEG